MIVKIKDTIQDCNINFLLGSGLSSPYLKTVGNIEILLTQLEEKELDAEKKNIIRISLYKKYFDDVISKNPDILKADSNVNDVLKNYYEFLKIINSVLLKRKSTILSKEINLFTTNIDIFLEKALEDINMEYNDGFNGRFKPSFDLSNFKKSRFKKSLHYDNTSEIPVFNLLKLHGSLTWEIAKGNKILFSKNLEQVKNIKRNDISGGNVLSITDSTTIETLIAEAQNKTLDDSLKVFLKAYEKLSIVNPTKEKFKQTVLNQTYYELLRIYSNELEKMNTVLFVMGFSFIDEHIRQVTLRAANSNPTLKIYVIAHSTESKDQIEKRFGLNNIKNRNIEFISPERKVATRRRPAEDEYNYDMATINKQIFGKLFEDEEEISPPSESQ